MKTSSEQCATCPAEGPKKGCTEVYFPTRFPTTFLNFPTIGAGAASSPCTGENTTANLLIPIGFSSGPGDRLGRGPASEPSNGPDPHLHENHPKCCSTCVWEALNGGFVGVAEGQTCPFRPIYSRLRGARIRANSAVQLVLWEESGHTISGLSLVPSPKTPYSSAFHRE